VDICASASFRRYRGASTLIIPIQIINRLHSDCLTYREPPENSPLSPDRRTLKFRRIIIIAMIPEAVPGPVSHSAPGKAGQFDSCRAIFELLQPLLRDVANFSDWSIDSIAVTFWPAEEIPTKTIDRGKENPQKKLTVGTNPLKKLRRFNSISSHRVIFTDQQKPGQTTEALR
jgi:hypothetical protein